MSKLQFEEETWAIRGAAIEVHKHLGYGFLEAVYPEALEIELKQRGIPFEAQKVLTGTTKGTELKRGYAADLVCYGQVVVEIKCISSIGKPEQAQLLNYLKATGARVDSIVNFGSRGNLEVDRMVL